MRRVRDPFPDEALSDSIDESPEGPHASTNFSNATVIVFLWLAAYAVGAAALMVVLRVGPNAHAVKNVLFTVASAQGNVGLMSGIVTPSSPRLPAGAKLLLTFNMWVGRLAVVPALVLFKLLILSTGDG